MKELSIEEKAKAYDEAIERAKVFKEHLLEINEKDYADEMDYVFPELAESEDEKIRKEIIDFVKSRGGFKGDWIAWLEKQGETSPILSNSPNTGKDAWSEEDEAVLDALIRMLEGEDVYVSPHLAVDWLKSLKERYTWKPSDEQMNALKHAFNDCSIAFADMKILATLYEQLKALHRYEQDT